MKTFWMVWRANGGHAHKRHETYELAVEECKRLAALNPNHDFYVLESKIAYRGTVTVAEVVEAEPSKKYKYGDDIF